MKTVKQIVAILCDAFGYVFSFLAMAVMIVYAYIVGSITVTFCGIAEMCEEGAGVSLSKDIKKLWRSMFKKVAHKELDPSNPF